MKILIDTREQYPYQFTDKPHFAGIQLEAAALQSGDYSLAGLTDRIAIERKELADIVQCLGKDRDIWDPVFLYWQSRRW